MKLLKIATLAFAIINFVRCTQDKTTPDFLNQAPNPEEEVFLEPDIVESLIFFNLGEKKSGNMPAPNGNLDFNIEEDQKQLSGYLIGGFKLDFETPPDYNGAYIQFKSKNGKTGRHYFDIRPARFVVNSHKQSQVETRKQAVISTARKLSDSSPVRDKTEIHAALIAGNTPGTICFDMSIYDSNGNISTPQEYCIEVEAWAGNENFVGEWELTRFTKRRNEESEKDIVIGEFNCENDSFRCNQQTKFVKFEACSSIDLYSLNIKDRGNSEQRTISRHKSIDYSLSFVNCEVVPKESSDSDSTISKWAYNEEKRILAIPDIELSNSPFETEVVEYEVMSLSSNTMVLGLSFDETDNQKQRIEYQYELFFEK